MGKLPWYPRWGIDKGLSQTLNQTKEEDGLFHKHLFVMCGMKNGGVVQDFNFENRCWRSLSARSKISLEFLKIRDDDFLTKKSITPKINQLYSGPHYGG